MVFMGAEGVPGETDLRQAADDDLLEMGDLFKEHDGLLNLFVQVNRRDKSERFDVRTSERFDIDASEQDATNGKALIAFMRWAFDRAVEFKETPTMLILWGHAYEFARPTSAGSSISTRS